MRYIIFFPSLATRHIFFPVLLRKNIRGCMQISSYIHVYFQRAEREKNMGVAIEGKKMIHLNSFWSGSFFSVILAAKLFSKVFGVDLPKTALCKCHYLFSIVMLFVFLWLFHPLFMICKFSYKSRCHTSNHFISVTDILVWLPTLAKYGRYRMIVHHL